MLVVKSMALHSGTWLQATLHQLSTAPTDKSTGQALLSSDKACSNSETRTLGVNSAFFDVFKFMQRYQPTNTDNKYETWNCGALGCYHKRLSIFIYFVASLARCLSHFTAKRCGSPSHSSYHLTPEKSWHRLLFLDESNRWKSWCVWRKYTHLVTLK